MILHIDMDAFFASIEQRDNPELRGKPVVVGGSKYGRGVVAAASYEARKFGIHSAMSGRQAALLCPHAVFVKSNGRFYSQVGKQVREILQRFSPVIQPLSCDEAFLDIAGTLRHFASVHSIATEIKKTIQDELSLTASVGAAPLKFIAKIASDIGKPNGCVIVDKSDMQDFIDPLPIARLWGVGSVAAKRLERFGVRTIADMRKLSTKHLSLLGNWADHLFALANCIDPRGVETDHSAKQISHERTFSEDIDDLSSILAVANFLTDQVCRRLRQSQRFAKTVTLKYRTHDFRTHTRSHSFKKIVCHLDDVWPTVDSLVRAMQAKVQAPVRLIGIAVSELTAENVPQQLDLFDRQEKAANHRLDAVSDQITGKLGEYAIYRGTAHVWAKQKISKEARDGSKE